LRTAGQFPGSLFDRLVNRLRLMSKLSLADPRRIQEGRIRILVRGIDPLTRKDFERGFMFRVVIPPNGDSQETVLYRTLSDGDMPEGAFANLLETAFFKRAGSFRLRLAASGSGGGGRRTRA
jgi:type II secretory ATPase GspE/PulE/Tfp pilus assembly ATPase PilB-like protein